MACLGASQQDHGFTTPGRVMPFYDNAPTLILDQLHRIAGGERGRHL